MGVVQDNSVRFGNLMGGGGGAGENGRHGDGATRREDEGKTIVGAEC